jgi:hypothetical protein
MASTLCFTGMLLFLLALLNGLAIPKMRSPRLGLSAHLTGIQSGTFLIAAGLLWPKLVINEPWNVILGHVTWISVFCVWFSLALAGAFGADCGAGNDHDGRPPGHCKRLADRRFAGDPRGRGRRSYPVALGAVRWRRERDSNPR